MTRPRTRDGATSSRSHGVEGAAAKIAASAPRMLRVRVKPNARTSSLEPGDEGTWIALLKAAPVDGKANAELIALVAKRFGCRKADVVIRTGTTSRTKLVSVAGK